jgi:RimJ/RimL family protein N-acetyltransferase
LKPPEPPLGDGVVALRPLDERDAPAVERALEDAEIGRWFDNSTVSVQDVVERASGRWERSEAAEFAILDGGRCFGSIWLDIGPGGRATVGYWLLPEARGKGLMTRAVVLVTRWAIAELDMKRIGLLADPRNAASVQVAERAGFKREGVLRSWAEVNGERVDHVSYSLLPADLR